MDLGKSAIDKEVVEKVRYSLSKDYNPQITM